MNTAYQLLKKKLVVNREADVCLVKCIFTYLKGQVQVLKGIKEIDSAQDRTWIAQECEEVVSCMKK